MKVYFFMLVKFLLGARGMAQAVECLLCKHKTLSETHFHQKKKKKKN
jgi:hypothetical protein